MKCHWRFKNHSTCRVKHGELCEKVLAPHSASQAPDLAPDCYLALTSGTTTPPPQFAAPIGTGASDTMSPQNLEQHQAGQVGSSHEQLYTRQIAKQANVYDSVYEAMRALFCIVNKLSIAELTHLSAICQTADDNRRVLRHTMSGNDKATWTSAHYAKIQSELKSLCLAMLELLDQTLIPQAMHDDTIAAYTKLRAEFRRCLAEAMRSEVKVVGACPAHSRDPFGGKTGCGGKDSFGGKSSKEGVANGSAKGSGTAILSAADAADRTALKREPNPEASSSMSS